MVREDVAADFRVRHRLAHRHLRDDPIRALTAGSLPEDAADAGFAVVPESQRALEVIAPFMNDNRTYQTDWVKTLMRQASRSISLLNHQTGRGGVNP